MWSYDTPTAAGQAAAGLSAQCRLQVVAPRSLLEVKPQQAGKAHAFAAP